MNDKYQHILFMGNICTGKSTAVEKLQRELDEKMIKYHVLKGF